MNQKNRIERSFTLCIILTVILSVLLYILSFILFYAIEPVSIDLNGGEPVIEVRDVPYMPGMAVENPFYIENDGSQAVYYRFYLDNVSGELADLVEVAVLNGNTVLYEGKAKELSRDNVSAADDILLSGDRRYLSVRFRFPEDANFSEGESINLEFDFCADAVRVNKNPNRTFD